METWIFQGEIDTIISMVIDILTLFPELFAPFLEWSMIKKAREIRAVKINVHNLRKWGMDKRGTVDDRPYGGGAGMILRVEPIYNALRALNSKLETRNSKQIPNPNSQNPKTKTNKTIQQFNNLTILLSPKGKLFNQQTARKLSKLDHIVLICGHYEGIDERVRKHLIDEEISIGNYVLSGGEIPAMTVCDAITRLLPKVLKKQGAAEIESFSPGLKKILKHRARRQTGVQDDKKQPTSKGLLAAHCSLLTEYPHYTRPENFLGWKVPKVLLSGNHKKIEEWRAKKIKRHIEK